MKIGISINGVLRDYFGQIEKVHTKYFPPSNSEDDEEIEGIKVLDYDLEKWVTFPEEEVEQAEITFDPNYNPFDKTDVEDDTEEIPLEKKTEQVTLEEFLYEKCTLEVFGSADESINGAIKTLNDLILEYPEHEFILMSKEGGLSVPSTYFFLSKTSCQCRNVKFVSDNEEHWCLVDMMVTDHPEIINTKPESMSCVVINKDYNKDVVQSHIRIESIKDLRDVLESMKETTI